MESQADQGIAHGWRQVFKGKVGRKEYGGQEALTLLRRYKSPSTTHFHKIRAAPKRRALGFYFNPRRNLGSLPA